MTHVHCVNMKTPGHNKFSLDLFFAFCNTKPAMQSMHFLQIGSFCFLKRGSNWA